MVDEELRIGIFKDRPIGPFIRHEQAISAPPGKKITEDPSFEVSHIPSGIPRYERCKERPSDFTVQVKETLIGLCPRDIILIVITYLGAYHHDPIAKRFILSDRGYIRIDSFHLILPESLIYLG